MAKKTKYINSNRTLENEEYEIPTACRHVLVDAWGCNEKKLADIEYLKEQCELAIEKSHAKIFSQQTRIFKDEDGDIDGISIIYLLDGRHLAVHTYPLDGYASLDFNGYANGVNAYNGLNEVVTALEASITSVKGYLRGTEKGVYNEFGYITDNTEEEKEEIDFYKLNYGEGEN